MTNEYYDKNKVQDYLECIDAINSEYDKKIDKLIQRRDEKTSFYNQQILLEKDKPTQPINQMFANAVDTNAINNLSTEQLNQVADILKKVK